MAKQIINKIPLKASDLKPNKRNPRTITDERLSMLEKSMRAFGDLSGIVFNARSGQLVGGHQRSKKIESASDIVIEQRFKKPSANGTIAIGHVEYEGERFHVRVVDWDKKTEKAANIAANKHGGEFDMEILSADLLELKELDFDMDLTGFQFTEVKEFLRQEVNKSLGDEEAVPDIPEKTNVKLGDLFVLGNHRLLCGDSTKLEDVERLMNGEKASVWSSDPPYGINHVEVANEKGQAKGYKKIQNDDLQDDELKNFILSSIVTSLPFLKENFAFYMWHAMKMQAYFSQAAAAAAAGIIFHRQIIWVKPQFVFGRGQYHWRHELCLMGWLQGNEPPFYGERNQSTVWEIGRENDKIHPTQKPVAIWEPPILNHTLIGEIIYEPFAGSGSNLIACEKNGRRCFSMELDPLYVFVILRRWAEFTGNDPMRVDPKTGDLTPWFPG